MNFYAIKKKFGYEKLDISFSKKLNAILVGENPHLDYSDSLNYKAFIDFADKGIDSRNAKKFNEALAKLKGQHGIY